MDAAIGRQQKARLRTFLEALTAQDFPSEEKSPSATVRTKEEADLVELQAKEKTVGMQAKEEADSVEMQAKVAVAAVAVQATEVASE